MIFQVLAAAAVAGMIMTSTTCAQRERDAEHEYEVAVASSEKRAWLGVSVEDMSERLARRMNAKTQKGALVNSVSDDSPAEKAGIKEDDIIVSFNGKTIDDAGDLTRAVAKAEPGKAVECVVMRRNDRKSIQVTVAKPPKHAIAWAPQAPGAPLALMAPGHFSFTSGGTLGLRVMDLNRQLAEYFEIPGGRGILVSEVEKEGPGAKAGLKAGDVIVSLGSVDVDDIDDLHWALGESKAGDTVTVGYVRKGARRSATVTVDEDSDPKGYRFRSHAAPEFNFDFDLEGLREEGIRMKEHQEQLRQELKRVQEEVKKKGAEAKRETERAAQEVKRVMRTRTI
jgi:C-terminal processing protease CtpA/Prc